MSPSPTSKHSTTKSSKSHPLPNIPGPPIRPGDIHIYSVPSTTAITNSHSHLKIYIFIFFLKDNLNLFISITTRKYYLLGLVSFCRYTQFTAYPAIIILTIYINHLALTNRIQLFIDFATSIYNIYIYKHFSRINQIHILIVKCQFNP